MNNSDSNHLKEFAGRHILIVEDEYFLADEVRRALLHLGATVVGPTGNVHVALDLIDDDSIRIDAAILDIYLDDELVFPVAERLESSGIPFVFASGYDPSIIPEHFSGFMLCEKPIELAQIAKALFRPNLS